MRLPNPFTAFGRWCLRRRLAMAGFDRKLADELYAVYTTSGRPAAERLAFERLVGQCYQDLKALDGGLN